MGYLVIKSKEHLSYNRGLLIQAILIFTRFALVAPIVFAQFSYPGAGLKAGAAGAVLMACACGLEPLRKAWDFDRIHRTIVFTPLLRRWNRKTIGFDEVLALQLLDGGMIEETCTQMWILDLVLDDECGSRVQLDCEHDKDWLISDGGSLTKGSKGRASRRGPASVNENRRQWSRRVRHASSTNGFQSQGSPQFPDICIGEGSALEKGGCDSNNPSPLPMD
jgi:hypothetical protein